MLQLSLPRNLACNASGIETVGDEIGRVKLWLTQSSLDEVEVAGESRR